MADTPDSRTEREAMSGDPMGSRTYRPGTRQIEPAASLVTGERPVPVLYIDIDGTVRHGYDEIGRFVNTAEDVTVFEEVPDLFARYKEMGWRIVGISNQGGIALGHMSFKDCADAMMETHRQVGQRFDKLAWCMHHPSAKDPEMAVCWCRKPKPGLIIESALALSEIHRGEIYPPHLAIFVGDRPEDLECARNAGLRFIGAAEWRTGKHIAEVSS